MANQKPATRLSAEFVMSMGEMRIGMHVPKLNCGWRKTSFALEGLLVQDAAETVTPAKFVRQVIVDPRRSHLNSFGED